jgi:uncharacterized protein
MNNEIFDEDGNTALAHAAGVGDIEAVRALIDAGADVNGRGTAKQTALMEAAAGGHDKIVWLLIDAGADIEAQDWCGNTSMDLARGDGVVALLLKAGADRAALIAVAMSETHASAPKRRAK